jgi:hypothetical protein
MRAVRATFFALVAVAGIAAACGGTTLLDSDGGATHDGAGTSDGGGGSACPGTEPQAGACSPPGLDCEYGNDVDRQCNVMWTCAGSNWEKTWPSGPPLPPTCGPHPPQPPCPPSFGAVPVGQHCAPLNQLCDYPEGRCACEPPPGGPTPLDAGAVASWTCQSPDGACPRPRPHIGSACSSPGQKCDYGACAMPGGVGLQCTGGMWQEYPVPCPQ